MSCIGGCAHVLASDHHHCQRCISSLACIYVAVFFATELGLGQTSACRTCFAAVALSLLMSRMTESELGLDVSRSNVNPTATLSGNTRWSSILDRRTRKYIRVIGEL
jgi:hypothetical protein